MNDICSDESFLGNDLMQKTEEKFPRHRGLILSSRKRSRLPSLVNLENGTTKKRHRRLSPFQGWYG